MPLAYKVQQTPLKAEDGSSTTITSDALGAALTVGSTRVAFVTADTSSLPTGVALSNGDTLTKIADAGGYCSIWAIGNGTAGSGVTAAATWASGVTKRRITLVEYDHMPAVLNAESIDSVTIASGTLAQLTALTNLGGTWDAIVLICGQTESNQTNTQIREEFALHELRRLSGDAYSHAYDRVLNGFTAATYEATYPDTSNAKRLCGVIIEAGDASDMRALLLTGQGALWMTAGEVAGGDDTDATGMAMGASFRPGNGQGWYPILNQAGYLDRLGIFVETNEKSVQCYYRLRDHVSGGELNAVIAIPGGETGWFYAATACVDYVPAGFELEGFRDRDGVLEPGIGSAPTVRVTQVQFRFTPSDGVSTVTKLMAVTNETVNSGSDEKFFGLIGNLNPDGSAYDGGQDLLIGETFTAANLGVYVVFNDRSTATRFALARRDPDTDTYADTGLFFDVPGGASGHCSSGILTEAVADGDEVVWHLTPGSGSGDFVWRGPQLDLISTTGALTGGLGSIGRVGAATSDFPLCGMNNVPSAGYSTETELGAPFRLTKLCIYVIDTDAGGTLTVYKDDVATDFVVTIPSTANHEWITAVGLVSATADDITKNTLRLVLDRTGSQLEYSVITWAAFGIDLTPPDGIIGELAWIHRTRRLPEDGSLVTETFSDEDMQCPEAWTPAPGFKEALVVDFGEAERTASDPVTGQWRASTCTVRYQRGRYFREQSIDPVNRYLMSGQTQMTTRANRAVLGDPYTVLVGAVVRSRPGPELTWEETYGDFIAYGKRANQSDLLPWRVLGDSFVVTEMTVIAEGLDLTTPEPTHYGWMIRVPEVDGASEQGFVFPPIYLGIETIGGIDKHAWMIAGHACAEIVNLRVDLTEVFTDPEWEIPGIGGFPKYEDRRSPTYGNFRRYSILRAPVTDLEAAEESLTNPDACALGVKKLTVALKGVEPNADGSGDAYTDRFDQYLHYEQNFGQRKGQDGYQSGAWLDTPTWDILGGTTPMIDEDSYAVCKAIALERVPATGSPAVGGYIGAGTIGARAGDRRTRADWKAAWNRSCSTRSGPTNLGADRIFMLHPTQAIKDAAELYTVSTEILRDSFVPDISWDQHQTRVTFFCDPLPENGQWQTTDTITDADAIRNYGDKDIPGEPRYYDFAPGITPGSHLAILESRRLAHPPRPVTLAAKVPPNSDGTSLGYAQVGDYYRYQHHESIGTSPHEIRLMQVESVRISPSRRSVIVKGYDVDDLKGYDEPDVAPEAVSPINETCASAIEFDGAPSTPFTVTQDTSGHATDASIDPPIVAVEAYHAAWFKVTPDSTGRLFATTVHSDYDTQMAILTGTCGTSPADWTVEDYNDNDNLLMTSVLDIPVTGGTTYFILVAGYGPDDGGRLVFGAQCYVP